MNDVRAWLRGFIPAPINAGRREKLCACLGAWIGLMFAGLVSKATLGNFNPWFIAPMGASAVLLFGMPSSPLAQPWSLVGGNIVSALVGIVCAQSIGDPILAASAAVAVAIAAMFALRCLHPPSGAVALTAVLGGPTVLASGYRFALWPVGLNSIFLLTAALIFNNLLRRRYPHAHLHHANPHGTADPLPTERLGFTRADLDEVLKSHQQLLDIDPDDLEEIFRHAELNAYHRRFGQIRCADLMSKDVITVQQSTSPQAVWRLLAKHRIKALPVVDDAGMLAGIVSLHDMMIGHEHDVPAGFWPPQLPRVGHIEQLMTRDVRTATPDQLITELVPLFSDAGYHHLPVVDAQRRVIGMVTQSDLVAALYRARLEETGKPVHRPVMAVAA
ncbi:HPP family protein [Noviherbaspirillum autotrophicum]|uniref:Membrane protein n=1 Tax=Noviherbaspirillum autotrophicum TaxID=709839 RepID=A0A0C2BRJ6_9BURK|nr:HPP family protein [Noviherbaspirillum autotrophicum]KIF80701.1 membrane protein [Noviherbaspirillum autotrophicum]